MKFQIEICPFTPDAEKDFRHANVAAERALEACNATNAKFYHQIARMYWARVCGIL